MRRELRQVAIEWLQHEELVRKAEAEAQRAADEVERLRKARDEMALELGQFVGKNVTCRRVLIDDMDGLPERIVSVSYTSTGPMVQSLEFE